MFIILNGIFSQLFISIFGLLNAAGQMIQVIPFIERVKPILEAVPEKTESQQKKMLLVGEIEIRNLSFRYHPDTSLILNNVSMVIKPQEWTSILGDSGAGKSTLYRLLLGFEVPLSGEILYDGVPMSQIDINHLRSQIGVVMQTSTLMPGSIMENIIGIDRQLSEKDAWNLASLACIDQEIQAMPMKMNTLIIEAGKAISYGQRQRLLIARALAKKPKILILDEAMGSLDNETTERVTKSLQGLGITIISSTHRLGIIKETSVFQLLDGKMVKPT
jgi:ATP-binding cassette subfamily C protein